MNKVILMGRLTHEPELGQTPNNISVTKFSIAVNRRFAKEGQQQADFINCVAWRQTAEFICRYFHKGSMIAVCGSIQTRSWDGKDGKKQYATEVVAEEAYFTGEKVNNPEEQKQPFPEYNKSDNFRYIDVNEESLPF
jgi:single-strand DNA-binding protein